MLAGKLVFLRAVEATDSQFYFNWINDPETNNLRGLYFPASNDEATQTVKQLAIRSQTEFTFAITDKQKNPIGFIGLRSICSRSRRGELWIYIGDKNYWNKGYGQDSLKTLLDFSFNEVNLHRIWLECDAGFSAAIKCYSKVGFKTEGVLKDGYFRNGKYKDTMIMAVLNKN